MEPTKPGHQELIILKEDGALRSLYINGDITPYFQWPLKYILGLVFLGYFVFTPERALSTPSHLS